jgi:hypothetical protein
VRQCSLDLAGRGKGGVDPDRGGGREAEAKLPYVVGVFGPNDFLKIPCKSTVHKPRDPSD